MNWRVHCGDVRKFCARYDGPPFHACLTDPPYGIKFMSKAWDDNIAFIPETWAALAKHLLPGAFGMTFAGSRGWHRVACAIEDAGLRLHPSVFLCWANGAGFPKATRVKGHEEFAGHRYGLQALKPAVEPIIVWQVPYEGKPVDSMVKHGAGALNIEGGRIGAPGDKTPAPTRRGNSRPWFTAASQNLGGDDTKGRWPANFSISHSPDCRRVGAKKVKGTLKAYTRKVDVEPGMYGGAQASGTHKSSYSDADGLETVEEWRCVESCPVRKLDEQSGISKGKERRGFPGGKTFGGGEMKAKVGQWYGGEGGASRFFFNSDWIAEVEEGILSADPVRYQAKAGRKERDAGLDSEIQRRSTDYGAMKKRQCRVCGNRTAEPGAGGKWPACGHDDWEWVEQKPVGAKGGNARNPHPTIKLIKLCRWLASLLLPPEQYAPRRILIPFAGAGSECAAAGLAGWDEIVGIEREAEYAEIARARLRHWLPDAAESA